MKILIKANKSYHSYIWPHASTGDQRWVDENILAKLNRDAGAGMFSVLKVEKDDVSIDLEKNGASTKVSPTPETKAKEVQPKRKPGRPKKVKDG